MSACEVMFCEEPTVGTVTLEADGGEGPVEWRVCGRHMAAVGAELLSTEGSPLHRQDEMEEGIAREVWSDG